ncbi:hypothetical protein [Microcystis aeruginosa]
MAGFQSSHDLLINITALRRSSGQADLLALYQL